MPLDSFYHDVGRILKGNANLTDGICKINIPRVELDVTILEVPTIVEHSFMFQPIPNGHKALILGSFVLIQEEVPHVIAALTKECIVVSAVHNHWLFDCPHLIYVHIEARARPKEFAQKLACILEQLSCHRFDEFNPEED